MLCLCCCFPQDSSCTSLKVVLTHRKLMLMPLVLLLLTPYIGPIFLLFRMRPCGILSCSIQTWPTESPSLPIPLLASTIIHQNTGRRRAADGVLQEVHHRLAPSAVCKNCSALYGWTDTRHVATKLIDDSHFSHIPCLMLCKSSVQVDVGSPRCVYWLEYAQEWADHGVTTAVSTDGVTVKCASTHMTNFAVLMQVRVSPVQPLGAVPQEDPATALEQAVSQPRHPFVQPA